MRKRSQKRGRYGTGGLWQRGPIWWIRYREVRRKPDGTVEYLQHRESTRSEDRDYAERLLRSKLLAIGGRHHAVVDPRKVSYEDLRENFLARCVEKKLRSLKHDKQGRPALATLPRLDRFFGGWRAAEITVADLRRFRAEGRHEGLSDARLNRYVSTIRAMFNQAARDELITRAEIPAYFPTVGEPNEARGAVFITPQWYAALRKSLKEPLRSAFTLAYHASVRVHELLRLRWRDVSVAKRLVTLPGEITKTGRARLVPLPTNFDLKPGKPDELVFPLGDFRESWRTACVRAGAGWYECRVCGERCDGRTCPNHGKLPVRRLRYRGARLRHCRHTAVRNMSDAGLPEARIMAVSGHVTRSMFDRYNIGREEDVAMVRKAVEQFHRTQQKRLRAAS
jgi:integrase